MKRLSKTPLWLVASILVIGSAVVGLFYFDVDCFYPLYVLALLSLAASMQFWSVTMVVALVACTGVLLLVTTRDPTKA